MPPEARSYTSGRTFDGMTFADSGHSDALGLPAVLPPPEEEKDVKTAIGAARAKQARKPTRVR